MKVNKFLMLGIAGLAFAACSNEEEFGTNQTFEGNGVVSVRIATPTLTRNAGAATSGADGGTVAITGDITVTLTGTDGAGAPYQESITISANELEPTTELKFWNIAVPSKLTASINGGQADYSTVAIDNASLQVAAANIPAYGETETFTKTTESDSPIIANDGDTEAGANEGDQDKVYQMYEAKVTMAIPVARLEVGGIYHVDEGEGCIYTALTLNGAYLDGYCENGSVYADGAYPNSTSPIDDYSFDGVHGTGAQSDLRDVIDPEIPFLDTNADNTVGSYTYNFYATGTNPIFKLYFENAEGTPANPVNEPRYAMVTRYQKWNDANEDGLVDDGEMQSVTFENGHIYRITKAELNDDNIIGDEGGNTLYGVTVTVVEAIWTIVDIDAEWAN